MNAPQYFTYLLTQWSNAVEITFLPVVRPTEEEKKDVTKYRDRLQEVKLFIIIIYYYYYYYINLIYFHNNFLF